MLEGNLYEDVAPPADGERFETLLQHRNLVVERIVSSSKAIPAEFVQDQDEWVVLLQGTAALEVNGQTRSLERGDYVFLPAGTPHAVRQVSEGALWLAVHLHVAPPQAVQAGSHASRAGTEFSVAADGPGSHRERAEPGSRVPGT